MKDNIDYSKISLSTDPEADLNLTEEEIDEVLDFHDEDADFDAEMGDLLNL